MERREPARDGGQEVSFPMVALLITLAVVVLVALVLAGANAIAYGRHPRRRSSETLRAEDAVETRARGNSDTRDSAEDATFATRYLTRGWF
jgi:hypothetical protein